ncbi:hypothetical protein DPMN_189741 [Dreissena polymorpha]|uniref:Uncharacterized protein n=1 Tax=Dreissena polymorpha TaxID=45954 RepID=A0A9D4DU38_DREPO|nr:hypothetical protein DPMN_189741 [Dreissena polymorpha]
MATRHLPRTVYSGWPFPAKSGSFVEKRFEKFSCGKKALRLHAEGPYHIKNIRTIKTNQHIHSDTQSITYILIHRHIHITHRHIHMIHRHIHMIHIHIHMIHRIHMTHRHIHMTHIHIHSDTQMIHKSFYILVLNIDLQALVDIQTVVPRNWEAVWQYIHDDSRRRYEHIAGPSHSRPVAARLAHSREWEVSWSSSRLATHFSLPSDTGTALPAYTRCSC